MMELSRTLEQLANRTMTKAQRKKFAKDHADLLRQFVDGDVARGLHDRLCNKCEHHIEQAQTVTEAALKK